MAKYPVEKYIEGTIGTIGHFQTWLDVKLGNLTSDPSRRPGAKKQIASIKHARAKLKEFQNFLQQAAAIPQTAGCTDAARKLSA